LSNASHDAGPPRDGGTGDEWPPRKEGNGGDRVLGSGPDCDGTDKSAKSASGNFSAKVVLLNQLHISIDINS